jgi:hypothetical protein
MQFIRRRAWYLTSIALGLAAIVVEIGSNQIVATGVVGIARATQAVHEGAATDVVEAIKHHATAQVNRGTGLAAIGLVVAVASAVCFFLSRKRYEAGPRLVPVIVWTIYVSFLLSTV